MISSLKRLFWPIKMKVFLLKNGGNYNLGKMTKSIKNSLKRLKKALTLAARSGLRHWSRRIKLLITIFVSYYDRRICLVCPQIKNPKMKNSLLLILLAFCTLAMISSCANDSNVRENAANSLDVPPATTPITNTPPPATPATAAGGVQHYICPNSCAGSGGAAQGNCPVCGTAYAHNQAYHNQTAPTTPTTPTVPTTTPGTTPGTTPTTPTTPPAPTPAQNAAGVWHYSCSNGCAGGAGAAGNCASCGSALAHNAAYHN